MDPSHPIDLLVRLVTVLHFFHAVFKVRFHQRSQLLAVLLSSFTQLLVFIVDDIEFLGEVAGDEFSKGLWVFDMNFDGIQDVIVGAPGYSSSTGRVYTFSTETTVTPADTQAGKLKGDAKGRGNFILR